MNIQEELDNTSYKERDSLFNNLQYLDIDNFTYQGKTFNILDLMYERDSFLNLQSVLLSDGTIFLNGGIVKELDV